MVTMIEIVPLAPASQDRFVSKAAFWQIEISGLSESGALRFVAGVNLSLNPL
jgi:hypothetical protein